MKTAVIYARYSSERQTEQSIEGQLRVCHDYAEKNDMIIIDTYIDRAMTGTNDNRTSFQKMLQDSNKRAWDIVLVYKLDRFSRNKYEMAMHKKTLRDNGIRLVSAMENIPDTPEGIILESLLEGMAEYYSAELSQKVRRGMNESRLKGQYTGGFVVYGYDLVNKKIVINEHEADIVNLIFQRYASGIFVKDIIAELNEKGIMNKYGRPFAINTIHHILENEHYTGIYRLRDEVFTNIYPRIISDELFNLVKDKKEANKYGGRKPDVIYLLSKKIKCGYCGRPVNGITGTSKTGKTKRYYCCSGVYGRKGCKKKYTNKEDLESVVIQSLQRAFLDDATISKLADMVLDTNKKRIENNSVISLLQKELNQVNSAINNMLAAIEKGVVTESTTKRLKELEAKQADLREKIVLEQSKEKLNISKNEVVHYLKKAQLSTIEKMTKMLIKLIVLYDDKIEIYCNYTNNKNGPDGNTPQGLLLYTDKTVFKDSIFSKSHGKDRNVLIKVFF